MNARRVVQQRFWSAVLFAWFIGQGPTGTAVEPSFEYQPLAPDMTQVQPTLLPLIHASEVQAELKLNGSAWNSFLPKLQLIDGPWWRARIRPTTEQRQITAQQETLLMDSFRSTFGLATANRLRQLELQAQGYRMLLRPEVASFLGISPEQKLKFEQIFQATDTLMQEASNGSASAELLSRIQKIRAAEPTSAHAVLTPPQQVKMGQIIGELLNTSNLQRIYPLAPELIDSGKWTGKQKVSLAALRGKVVLVHFYAFQCHNCQANFHIYNRWQEQYGKRGVLLIGIQTPETTAEGDPRKVCDAAEADGFQFPVLIDLTRDNWNAWSNTMWPTVYVIDKKGYIRFWWQGELNWEGATVDKKIEKLVDELLKED